MQAGIQEMRLVVQRVAQASVTCHNVASGAGSGGSGGGRTESIAHGVMCLVGIEKEDTQEDAAFCAQRLLQLRLFHHSEPQAPSVDTDVGDSDGGGSPVRWVGRIEDVEGEILFVSQFTLHAVYKGGRPSFHRAMPPAQSEAFFYDFVESVRAAYVPQRVKCCVFGSYMNVSLVNSGPVTMIIDSRNPKGG
ncbi:D-tyrosyl-tRNA(Tyr) deacylase [Porphyridium purpureum]|uniref:D-aminoacyl-tRNA deacylase n=1 Tax=Porphyridium purpureum TaxID=35688 RepID=A0A5J4Z8N5_PORPP|nr:D-tyrosyl-tRNA(Tyr) deacylase [Porphyridium purpureum]|eukprot:POR0125..scf295_1